MRQFVMLAAVMMLSWPLLAANAQSVPPSSVAPSAPPTTAPQPLRLKDIPVRFVLDVREGSSQIQGHGLYHNAAGFIVVTQTQPDQLVVIMSGMTATTGFPLGDSLARMTFELAQHFHIVCDNSLVNAVHMTMDSQVVGFLRYQRGRGS